MEPDLNDRITRLELALSLLKSYLECTGGPVKTLILNSFFELVGDTFKIDRKALTTEFVNSLFANVPTNGGFNDGP